MGQHRQNLPMGHLGDESVVPLQVTQVEIAKQKTEAEDEKIGEEKQGSGCHGQMIA
jgi:hypothetical protein